MNEDLYKGTSKGAEGYAVRLMFKRAVEEGMNIAIQWQDADSSFSKAVIDHFPNAEIMICGVHAGRAHKKQLEELSKMKKFTEDLIKKHKARFPSVVDLVCHHKAGRGCMSDEFIKRARNNFSLILSRSETAEEFSAKMKALARHARDEHEWDDGQCDFHQIRVCSCKQCDGDDLRCKGRDYHTRCALTCPFHSLTYEIECHERSEMCKQLVHPILKRGHSNWPEASHSVFIRFRPKHINLERLHYVVSTELALLQSNMTYMYEKYGPQYYWVVELFRLLRLPVFDGVHAALEAFNEQRKQELDRKKTERYKRRRVQLKEEKNVNAQRRKEWSKKHGHDTYGDVNRDEEVKPTGPRAHKKNKVSTEGKCRACGSTTHRRSTHRDCPDKKVRGTDVSSRLKDDQMSENSDVIGVSEDSLTDEDEFSSDEHAASSDSDWCLEDDILRCSECTCGAVSQTHNKDCPLSSRDCDTGCTSFAKADSKACSGVRSTVADVEKTSVHPAELGKRERLPSEKPPTVSKRKPKCSSFQVGDYVSVHSKSSEKYHIPCRVVQVVGKVCRLYCGKGVLNRGYTSSNLMPLSSGWNVSVENWRTAAEVSIDETISDPDNIEVCRCHLASPSQNIVDLTSSSEAVSAGAATTSTSNWLCNALYTLTSADRGGPFTFRLALRQYHCGSSAANFARVSSHAWSAVSSAPADSGFPSA